MRITLDECDTRPAPLFFEPDQILVKRIVPTGPSVPQIVRGKFGVEAGTASSARPGGLDLPAIAALAIDIGTSVRTKEYRPLAMAEIGERRNSPRRQLRDTPLAAFGVPEDRPGAREIDIPPVELHRLGHAGPGADEKRDQRPQVRRSGLDKPIDPVG